MHPDEPPPVIEVRYKTGYAVFQFVFGGLVGLLGLGSALVPGTGYAIVSLFPAAVLIALGAASVRKPYCSFDSEVEALYLHPPLFGAKRAVGAPRGERLYLDRDQIIRETPNGKRRQLNLSMAADAEDLVRLKQALPTSPQR